MKFNTEVGIMIDQVAIKQNLEKSLGCGSDDKNVLLTFLLEKYI